MSDRQFETRLYYSAQSAGIFFTSTGSLFMLQHPDIWSALLVVAGGIFLGNALVAHDRMNPPPKFREIL